MISYFQEFGCRFVASGARRVFLLTKLSLERTTSCRPTRKPNGCGKSPQKNNFFAMQKKLVRFISTRKNASISNVELERAQNIWGLSCCGFLISGLGFSRVDRKVGLSLSGPWNSLSLTRAYYTFFQALSSLSISSSGSIGYWAFSLRAFLPALAFEPGQGPIPAPSKWHLCLFQLFFTWDRALLFQHCLKPLCCVIFALKIQPQDSPIHIIIGISRKFMKMLITIN